MHTNQEDLFDRQHQLQFHPRCNARQDGLESDRLLHQFHIPRASEQVQEIVLQNPHFQGCEHLRTHANLRFVQDARRYRASPHLVAQDLLEDVALP